MHEALRDLTRHMTPDEAGALLRAMRPLRVPKGGFAVREGQQNDALYVVTDGRLAVEANVQGKVVKLGEKRVGQSFGELSLLTEAPTAAAVRALVASELLVLTREHLAELGRRDPQVELALIRALTEDLAERIRECAAEMRAQEGRLTRLRGAFGRLLGGRA